MKNYEFVVSACLAGLKCKYNGGSNPCEYVKRLYKEGRALPLCPETLAELPVPRAPSEIRNGKVVSKDGDDLTSRFLQGAKRAMVLARSSNAKKAILKSRSPSCGYREIYDGSFSRTLCAGNGVWTEGLIEAGFEIFTEESLPD